MSRLADIFSRRALSRDLLLRSSVGALATTLALWGLADERWGQHEALRIVRSLCVVALLGFAGYRVAKEAGRAETNDWHRWDLAVVACVATLEASRWATGTLSGPVQGLLFLWAALCSAFLADRALLGALGFGVAMLLGTEAVLGWEGVMGVSLRAGLVLCCGGVVRLSVKARLSETELGNKLQVERKLTDLRDEARAYRLSSAPGHEGLTAALSPADGPDERLVQSSVEEIQEALASSLSVCRAALGARSAVALWLTEDGNGLVVRGASSEEAVICRGPFPAKEGIFGAALEGDCPLELSGPSAGRPLPYYSRPLAVGHVAVLPLRELDEVVGLLVVDRKEAEPLSESARMLLAESGKLACRTIDNERLLLSLDRTKAQQGGLYRAVERLNEVRTEAGVVEVGVSSARHFAAFDFAAVTVLRNGEEHEICAVSGDGADGLVGKSFRAKDGLVAMAVDNRQVLPFRGECDAGFQVVFTRALPVPAMNSLLVVPLVLHEQVLGTIVLGSQASGAFGGPVRMHLQVLARHMAVSLSNARMVKRLEELATTDGLTGLLNKRAVQDVAVEKLRSAQRFNTSLAVIVCDLDHFKAINDQHGHDIGDQVIAGFAEVLRRSKRETDAVGRFGGEEFVLVCEQTEQAGAEMLAERIRTEMEATRFATQQGAVRVTCSLGIATRPQAGADWGTLFKAADDALYRSKKAGRNRATTWVDSSRQSSASLSATA